jgi:hypothetical protein
MGHTVGLPTGGGIGVRTEEKKQIGMLGGIPTNKFPRPDLSKWMSYKCEPGQAKGPHRETVRMQEEEPEDETLLVPEPVAILFNSLPKRSVYHGTNF